jgi:hypothetical protein
MGSPDEVRDTRITKKTLAVVFKGVKGVATKCRKLLSIEVHDNHYFRIAVHSY